MLIAGKGHETYRKSTASDYLSVMLTVLRAASVPAGRVMGAIALQALAEETGGQLYGESVPIQHLKIDSVRSQLAIFSRDLRAACRRARLVPQAVAAGASAVLTERKVDSGSPQLVVSNITHASGRFGYLKRQAFTGDIIAITGSAGKTTTRI